MMQDYQKNKFMAEVEVTFSAEARAGGKVTEATCRYPFFFDSEDDEAAIYGIKAIHEHKTQFMDSDWDLSTIKTLGTNVSWREFGITDLKDTLLP